MFVSRIAAVAAVIGIWGAASAAEPPQGKADLNACKFLSDQEVSAAIGLPVEPGLRRDSGHTTNDTYSSTCLWRVAADRGANDANAPLGGARFAILNLQAWPVASGNAHKFLQEFRDAARDNIIPNKPVELKIADEALWWGDGVAVRKGDFSFGISVHLIDGRPKERGIEETLARQIAGRL